MTPPPQEPPPPEPFPLKPEGSPPPEPFPRKPEGQRPPPPEPFFLEPERARPLPPPGPAVPLPRPGPPPSRSAARDDERRARARRSEEPKKKGRWKLFVLFNLVLIGIAVFWATRSEEQKQRFLEAFPPGVGGRVTSTVLALVLMLVLAWLVLPGARVAVLTLTRAGERLRALPRGKRLLMLPVRAGLEIVWLLAQVLFALDAVGILLAGVAFLLYAIKIAKPDLFPFLP